MHSREEITAKASYIDAFEKAHITWSE